MEQERKLPIYTIEGTEFIIDVARDELRQVDRPENTIPFSEMGYQRLYYDFRYDLELKNIADGISASTKMIHVPNMTELDPVGMSQKYGSALAEITGKNDLELMVDQKQLASRQAGQLPVIEIAGHPFYVDLRIDRLRPADDFSTMGIRISDIYDYYDEGKKCYVIPYDPKGHAYKELDFETIKAIPKGITVIEIPSEQQLDPIAYARLYGFNQDHILRNNPLQMQQKARELSWDETPIKQIIARNLKRELDNQQSQNPNKPRRKRGRGI